MVTERPLSFVVFSDENSVGFAQTTIKAADEKGRKNIKKNINTVVINENKIYRNDIFTPDFMSRYNGGYPSS